MVGMLLIGDLTQCFHRALTSPESTGGFCREGGKWGRDLISKVPGFLFPIQQEPPHFLSASHIRAPGKFHFIKVCCKLKLEH